MAIDCEECSAKTYGKKVRSHQTVRMVSAGHLASRCIAVFHRPVAASFQTQGVYKLDGPEFGNSRVYKLDTSIAQLVCKLF